MVALCAGALLIGTAASFMVPLLPFVCVVMIAELGMTLTMALQGHGFWRVCMAAAALLVTMQVGYGCGMILSAVSRPLLKPFKHPVRSRPVDDRPPRIKAANKT